MMTDELKPCPFCGSRKVNPTGWIGQAGDGKATSGPACDDCGATAPDADAWNLRDADGERWRHVKRGTEYTEIGRAELQAANGPVAEGNILVIYRGDDGRLWSRREDEFADGRFERVAP